MIVVHEGLPRSGKSYEAVVRRIIPALQAGRVVWTNIEGVDHVRVAEASELPPEKVTELLHVLTPEHLSKLWECDLKNCLLVLDEVQNTWGVKAKLSPEMVKFVAEHGHHGIDVILMTQDIKDIHVIWRRRVEVRQVTMKLTAIGKSNSYSVTTYRGKGSELYEKVGTKVVKYDPKYFGTYKSYSDTDVSTAVLADDRASVWGSTLFTRIIPSMLAAAVIGGWFLWDFFHPEEEPPKPAAVPARPMAAAPPAAPPVAVPGRTASKPAALERMRFNMHPATEMLEKLAEETRPRLAAVMRGADGRVDGVVEWVTEGGKANHRLTFRQLRDLGVTVEVRGDAGAILRSGSAHWLATSWPMEEPLGRLSAPQLAQVSVASVGVQPVASGLPSGALVPSAPVVSAGPGAPSQDRAADLQLIRDHAPRSPLVYGR